MGNEERKRPDVTIEFGGRRGGSSAAPEAAAPAQASAPAPTNPAPTNLKPGKGLDVGTANLLSAVRDREEDEVGRRRERAVVRWRRGVRWCS